MDPGTAISRTQEEQEALAGAAREAMRHQILELLDKRGLAGSADLIACSRCGERTISLAQAATWVKDRATKQRICAACGTEQALLDALTPSHEIGGEG